MIDAIHLCASLLTMLSSRLALKRLTVLAQTNNAGQKSGFFWARINCIIAVHVMGKTPCMEIQYGVLQSCAGLD